MDTTDDSSHSALVHPILCPAPLSDGMDCSEDVDDSRNPAKRSKANYTPPPPTRVARPLSYHRANLASALSYLYE
jgi:hypothetical protein